MNRCFRHDSFDALPSGFGRFRGLMRAMVVAALMHLTLQISSAGDSLFHEGVPFDRITLTQANGGTVLEVSPLPFPDRLPPDPLPRTGTIRLWLLDRPGEEYELFYASIAKIETFEQIVLDQARAKRAAGELDDAFECLAFLHAWASKLPGLEAEYDALLWAESQRFQQQGDHHAVLARLRVLLERKAEVPQLAAAWGETADALAAAYIEQDDYRSIRLLALNTLALFPDHPVAVRWRRRLAEQAAELLTDAQRAAADHRYGDAYAACRRAERVWPDLPGLSDFHDELRRQYPRVVVGVTSFSIAPSQRSLTDWAGRRDHRLVRRSLVEFAGPAVEGGRYTVPLGQFTSHASSRVVEFRFRDDIRWASDSERVLRGVDVAQTLLDPALYPVGNTMIDRVTVTGLTQVQIELGVAHVRPEALFCIDVWPREDVPLARSRESLSVAPRDADPRAFRGNGPYILSDIHDGRRVFTTNPVYADSSPNPPREIVQSLYTTRTEALAALRNGEIDLVDRVNPWDIEALRGEKGIRVQRYSVPLVHCLVPNMRKPLIARRDFRRALVYGIDREGILQTLCDGVPPAGCRVVSGPFLAGFAFDDPLAYAYDASLQPRRYNPILATALAEMTRQTLVAEAAETDAHRDVGADAASEATSGETALNRPMDSAIAAHRLNEPLILAHPPHDSARVACAAIQRQLALVGIDVRLEELPVQAEHLPEEADLWYVELAIWEPLVDASRVLGPNGLAARSSDYINLLLRQLEMAEDWAVAGQRLRRLHHIAHHEVALLPLWQLTEYFAYRDTLATGPTDPVVLFQNVEQWQVGPPNTRTLSSPPVNP